MDNHSRYRSDLFHVAVIVGAALAIGVYLIVTCVVIAPDGVFYIGRAKEFAQNPWFAAGRFPPGYPALLAAAHKVASLFAPSEATMTWVYSAQAVTLLSRILALVCLYFLGKLLTDARRSFWAVLTLTFLPYPADYGSLVLREWPAMLFVALGVWLLLRSMRDRKWWGFGLVGLATGLGYLIRPETAQVLVYAAAGLVVMIRQRTMRQSEALAALLALAACFLVPATPHLLASGTLVPYQLRPPVQNRPPVITSIARRSAGDQPLEFDIPAGELLDLRVDTSDPEGGPVTLSVVTVPVGTRPAYRFEAVKVGDCFLTLSESEKNTLISNYMPGDFTYEGIAFYAWPSANERQHLEPVYGLWLQVPGQHVFTIRESERQTVLERIAGNQVQGNYVAFYAFGPDSSPPNTIPIYRFQDSSATPHWSGDAPGNIASGQREIAWYAHGPAEPPAGLELNANAIRWRPRLDQQGSYGLNVIAGDGYTQSCQLLHINVVEPPETSTAGILSDMAEPEDLGRSALPEVRRQEEERASAWDALHEIGGAFGENLMYFLVVPLALGLYRFLRSEAGLAKRALTAMIVAVNIGLMFARHVWIEPGPARRYCLVLVVFSLFHVPAGGQTLARWIQRLVSLARRHAPAYLTERFWFGLLISLAIGPMCLPKLITPLGIDKQGYQQAAQWLRENTNTDDLIAAPDVRIAFYADRKGFGYRGLPDPKAADYIVTIVGKNDTQSVPDDWDLLYSPAVGRHEPDRVTVYKSPFARQ